MARLMTLKQNLTYNSKRAAIAAVCEVYRACDSDISYLIVNDDAGRFYPVFMPKQLGLIVDAKGRLTTVTKVEEMQNDFYTKVWQRYLKAKA